MMKKLLSLCALSAGIVLLAFAAPMLHHSTVLQATKPDAALTETIFQNQSALLQRSAPFDDITDEVFDQPADGVHVLLHLTGDEDREEDVSENLIFITDD